MLVLLRRFLVLVALMFWQGGFLFYAAVVVPIGQKVLGSHLEQGMITRVVTDYMNISGVVALAIFIWDCRAEGGASRVQRARYLSLFMMGLGLVGLFALHPYLDGFIDADAHELHDAHTFRTAHRVYLWVSTAQWMAGLGFTFLTLMVWQSSQSPAAVRSRG